MENKINYEKLGKIMTELNTEEKKQLLNDLFGWNLENIRNHINKHLDFVK